MTRRPRKPITLALQGGGMHGAFTWGVLDRLLEEDRRLEIEGVSATSAGAMNAAVLAYGLLKGGSLGARQALHDFWRAIALSVETYHPFHQMPWF
jgi:NTE family protein